MINHKRIFERTFLEREVIAEEIRDIAHFLTREIKEALKSELRDVKNRGSLESTND